MLIIPSISNFQEKYICKSFIEIMYSFIDSGSFFDIGRIYVFVFENFYIIFKYSFKWIFPNWHHQCICLFLVIICLFLTCNILVSIFIIAEMVRFPISYENLSTILVYMLVVLLNLSKEGMLSIFAFSPPKIYHQELSYVTIMGFVALIGKR